MTAPPKILIVAMHNSPHTARWIEMMADFGYDIHLFPVQSSLPHHKLRNLTLYLPAPGITLNVPASEVRSSNELHQNRAWRRFIRLSRLARSDPVGTFARVATEIFQRMRKIVFRRPAATILNVAPPVFDAAAAGVRIRHVPVRDINGKALLGTETIRLGRRGESDQTALETHGPGVLASLICDLKPDLIHSMEFQHSAYLVLAARDLVQGPFPRWLATNWGSDIFYFGRQPEHARQIKRVCESIDLYSCECHRDLALGREFGYSGPDLPVVPNSGGMEIDQILSLRDAAPPSRRKLIMVKGYDHFAGRAMISLAVLERFAAELRDYTIVLYSVGAKPRARAMQLAGAGILKIKIIAWAPHDEMLRHFGKARIYLGISVSDAISTSVLEAMAMGAFPIQTDTSCCGDWFIDGRTGFAVPPDNFETICARFRTALLDDALVDNAAIENLGIIKSRLAMDVIRPRIKHFYRQALQAQLHRASS
jgi:glycosyltransferase involved in cell wall biosynthesis